MVYLPSKSTQLIHLANLLTLLPSRVHVFCRLSVVQMCERCVSSDQSFCSEKKTIAKIKHHTISLAHQLKVKLSMWHGVSPEPSQLIAGCVCVRRGEVLPDGEEQLCHQSHPPHRLWLKGQGTAGLRVVHKFVAICIWVQSTSTS